MNKPANAPHAQAADLTIPHDAQVTAVPKNNYRVHWFEIICCDSGDGPTSVRRDLAGATANPRTTSDRGRSCRIPEAHQAASEPASRFIGQATRTRDFNAN